MLLNLKPEVHSNRLPPPNKKRLSPNKFYKSLDVQDRCSEPPFLRAGTVAPPAHEWERADIKSALTFCGIPSIPTHTASTSTDGYER